MLFGVSSLLFIPWPTSIPPAHRPALTSIVHFVRTLPPSLGRVLPPSHTLPPSLALSHTLPPFCLVPHLSFPWLPPPALRFPCADFPSLPPDLMNRCPELMNAALHLHDSMLLKAKSDNYGYTVEQEGDRCVCGGGRWADICRNISYP